MITKNKGGKQIYVVQRLVWTEKNLVAVECAHTLDQIKIRFIQHEFSIFNRKQSSIRVMRHHTELVDWFGFPIYTDACHSSVLYYQQ